MEESNYMQASTESANNDAGSNANKNPYGGGSTDNLYGQSSDNPYSSSADNSYMGANNPYGAAANNPYDSSGESVTPNENKFESQSNGRSSNMYNTESATVNPSQSNSSLDSGGGTQNMTENNLSSTLYGKSSSLNSEETNSSSLGMPFTNESKKELGGASSPNDTSKGMVSEDDNTQASQQKKELKTEKPVNHSVDTPKSTANIVDATGFIVSILCLGFFLLLQNFAQHCKRYCQTDASLSNSIISGTGLGYIFVKGFPFMFDLVQGAVPHLENIYLKKSGHLLLATFMALGLGFILNYLFEKKIGRNIVEDVQQSKALYRLNLNVLCITFFFASFHLVSMISIGLFDLFEYGFFIGLLLCMETATLCNIFTNRNDWLRRGSLSVAAIAGFLIGKVYGTALNPAVLAMMLSFLLGFLLFTTMRIELATVKRNSNYTAFIISFVAIVALTLIQSLYESVTC